MARFSRGASQIHFVYCLAMRSDSSGLLPIVSRQPQLLGITTSAPSNAASMSSTTSNLVPAFFTGLRLAMTLTLLGVILAELYVSTGGIGYYTRLYAESYNPAPLFALIGSLAVIAVTFNELVRIAERRLTPGSRSPRKTSKVKDS